MNHADFRVGGKIFATLQPGETVAVAMLTRDEQDLLVAEEPDVFSAVPGGWGLKGATRIALSQASDASVLSALKRAWSRRAPKRLLRS